MQSEESNAPGALSFIFLLIALYIVGFIIGASFN